MRLFSTGAPEVEGIAGVLGLEPNASLSTAVLKAFIGHGLSAIGGSRAYTEVIAESHQALMRLLRVCSEERWAFSLVPQGAGGPEGPEGDVARAGAPSGAVGGEIVASRSTGVGSIEARARPDGAIEQAMTLFDTPCERLVFSAGGAEVWRAGLEEDIGEPARTWASDHRVFRASGAKGPSNTRPPEWGAVERLDRDWGAIAARGEHDPLFRPYLMFGARFALSAPPEVREDWDWVASEADASGDPNVPIPIDGPYWQWDDIPLVHVGHADSGATLLFCDEEGCIWRYNDEMAVTEIVAGSAASYFSVVALLERLRRTIRDVAAIRISTDTAPDPSASWGWTRLGAMSDAFQTLYTSASVGVGGEPTACDHGGMYWIRRRARGPGRAEIRLVGGDAEALAETTRRVIAEAPGATVAVETSRSGGVERGEALRRAGIRWSALP